MNDKLISFGDAARMLHASGKATGVIEARKWLIAALMLGKFDSWADAFWIWDSETTPNKPHHIGDEAGVPRDFWRLPHAQHFSLSQISLPSGASGDWEISRFRYQIHSTANAARQVNSHYAYLDYLGSKIVCLETDAIGCSVQEMDVQRLIERGYAKKLISNARGISGINSGKLFETVAYDNDDGSESSISALDVIAQFVARALTEENQAEIRDGQWSISDLLRRTNPTVPIDVFSQLGAIDEIDRKVKRAVMQMPTHAPT